MGVVCGTEQPENHRTRLTCFCGGSKTPANTGCNQVRDTTADPRRSPRPAATGASSSRHVAGRFVEDGLSSPSTTCEEAPFAVGATTCHDAPFVVRTSLPVRSPKSALRCGDSNRPRLPPGVFWSSAHPFVPPSLARAGRLIGIRARHRRDRTVAIGRISYSTTQTWEFRQRGLSLDPPGLWSSGGSAIGSAGESLFPADADHGFGSCS